MDEAGLPGAPSGPSGSEPATDPYEQPTELSSDNLRSAQRHGLAALQARLRASLALLRRETHEQADEELEGEAADGSGTLASWLGLSLGLGGAWHSSPPSPPASQGSARGAARDLSTNSAKWSSGLCSCLRDPSSCVRVALCWPIVAGQLGQKIVRSRSLCKCFALPMLLVLALVELPLCLRAAARWARGGMGEAAPPHWHLGLSTADEEPSSSGSRYLVDGRLLAGLCFGALVLYYTLLRTLVRQRDGIPGSPLRDFCVALCCCCCGVCQLARHENLVAGQYGGFLSPTGEKQVAIDTV